MLKNEWLVPLSNSAELLMFGEELCPISCLHTKYLETLVLGIANQDGRTKNDRRCKTLKHIAS